MSGWTDILQDIKQRHSFLRQLKVCGSQHFSSPLPEALQASFDIAENLRCGNPDYKHLAMIFPLLLDCPEWIAVGCSLSAIKQDFFSDIKSLTPFSPGQKLLLDGKYVVEYVKEEELYGAHFLWMKMSAKSKSGRKPENTIRTFPVSDRLRFQPTDTRKPLTLIENIDSQPSDQALDQLLDIGSFGNRSIFTNEVVLVSRLTRVRQFAEKTHIVNPASPRQSVSLRDLFQWGGITVEGELEQWGHQQIDAEPVIGVAPDLITLREYLFNRQESDVQIILDGNLPFANDLQVLDEILDEGYPLLALMENRHLDDLKHLEGRDLRLGSGQSRTCNSLNLPKALTYPISRPPFVISIAQSRIIMPGKLKKRYVNAQDWMLQQSSYRYSQTSVIQIISNTEVLNADFTIFCSIFLGYCVRLVLRMVLSGIKVWKIFLNKYSQTLKIRRYGWKKMQ